MPQDSFRGGLATSATGTWGSNAAGSGSYGNNFSSGTTGNRLRAFHNMSSKHRKRNNGNQQQEKESPCLHFHTISRGGILSGRNAWGKCCTDVDKKKPLEKEVCADEEKTKERKSTAENLMGDSMFGNLFWEENGKKLADTKENPGGEDCFAVKEEGEKTKTNDLKGVELSQLNVQMFPEKDGSIIKEAKVKLSQLNDLAAVPFTSSERVFVASPFVAGNGYFDQHCSLNSAAVSPLIGTISPLEYPLSNVSISPAAAALGGVETGSQIYSLTSAHFSAEQLSFPVSAADTSSEVISPHFISPSAASALVTPSLSQECNCTIAVSNVFTTSVTPTSPIADPQLSPSPVSPFTYPYNSYWPQSTCFANDTKLLAAATALDNNNTPGYFANSTDLMGVGGSTLPFSIASTSAAAAQSTLLPHVPLGGAAPVLQSGANSDFYVLIRNVPLSAPDSLLASLLSTQTNNLKSFNRNNTQCKLLFATVQDALLSVQLLHGKKFCGNFLEATIASRPCMAALTNTTQNPFATTASYPVFGTYGGIPFVV